MRHYKKDKGSLLTPLLAYSLAQRLFGGDGDVLCKFNVIKRDDALLK